MRPRALVTGAARRVGRAIALELARDFDLALHAHTSSLDEVAERCEREGAQVVRVRADLATPTGCAAVVDQVLSRWDHLSLLVNNASRFEPVPFSEIELSHWAEMQDINLRAPFLLSQGLLSALRAADPAALGAPEGQHGVVIHLCDIGAERPLGGYAAYSVSKAGLLMLVRAMAVELAPAIRTVGISPGQVAWPASYPPEKRERIARRIPLGRAGTPEDIAEAVRFLATRAHYANGTVWTLDGGLSARY